MHKKKRQEGKLTRPATNGWNGFSRSFFPYKSAAFWCQGGSGQLSHRDMNANVQANWLFLQRVDA